MKVAGDLYQWFNGRVRQAMPGEMGVVERQCQAGYLFDKPPGRFRIRHDRANVGLNAQNDVVHCCLLDPPGQFLYSPVEGGVDRLCFKVDAGQDGDMLAATFGRIVERLQEPIARFSPALFFRMIQCVRHEIFGDLQEDIGRLKAVVF